MTARLLVLLVAVCMVLTVAPHLAEGFLPKASADTVSYSVPSGATPAQINTQLRSYAEGTVVNMLLTSDIRITGSEGDGSVYNAQGIVIPSGLTVNLFMNGKTIRFKPNTEENERDAWRLPNLYAITNDGTLNVYSGSEAQHNLVSGTALITLENKRTDMSRGSEGEAAYANLAAIKNSGALTVNKSVEITVTVVLEYGTGGDNNRYTFVNVAASGIYNDRDNASCIINGAVIASSARGRCAHGHPWLGIGGNNPGGNRSLSYGVYGGKVTINSGARISVNAETSATEGSGGWTDYGKAKTTGVAYGVCTSQQITVNGGTFSYSANVDGAHDGMKNATSRFYMGGLCYSSTIPVMPDGTINAYDNSVKKTNDNMGNISLYVFEAPISKMPVLPVSGYTVATSATYRDVNCDYNITGATAGQYKDECDNPYETDSSTTDGEHPKSIIRGALAGFYRVHVVYRYWETSAKNNVDASIVSNEGYAGYSYKPTGDGTNVVKNAVVLTGLKDNKTLLKSKESGIGYSSGGDSKNDFYWKKFNMATISTSEWFSDYDVASSSHRGNVFKSFVDSTDGAAGTGTEAPIYIFVDYYKVSPTGIKGEVGTNNAATVTYTGEPIKASSFNLKIKKGSSPYDDFTSDYNIDMVPGVNDKIQVDYSWHNKFNNSDSGEGVLPTNAGTYAVTLNVADSTVYDPNDCAPETHKNRNSLSYEFELVIEKAPVTRGSLPEDVTLTYGTRLNEALALSGFTSKGVQNENVTGTFSFANQQDGSAFKPVGSGSVSILWTPGAASNNYCQTSFTVNYTVNAASLVISPKAASVVYGETAFTTPFAIQVEGLTGNDNTEQSVALIASAIQYEVFFNGEYTAYVPGVIPVGSYDIRARVIQDSVPALLSNYEYTYADVAAGHTINQLTVTRRPLIVTATATSRSYQPDNFTVQVIYQITEGRFSNDDVRFTPGTGTLSDCNAGTQPVGGVNSPSDAAACIAGGTKNNYQITELRYATGASLTVEITKAMPNVTIPIVNDLYYQRTRTLSDVPLEGSTTSVEGTWSWVADGTNPTVAVGTYPAKFEPSDSVNYDTKFVDVPLNVRPTPVKITFSGSVEYGDPSPNLTEYTYISEKDPSFSIEAVETNGNIRFESTYTAGAEVSEEGYPVHFTLQNFIDAQGNYLFTAEDGRIVVTPRNIEFTVQNVSVEYGDSFNPNNTEITYDQSRLVGSDTINDVTSTGSVPEWRFFTNFDSSSNYGVGSYYLNATPVFATSRNYTVSVKNGTLNVTKAPLTIRANNVTLPYNSDVPANLSTAYTFVGVKRNEQPGEIVTDGQISVQTNYYKGAPVSADGYYISLNTQSAQIPNYSVTVEDGVISVVKANPVILAYPTASIVYGQTLAQAVFTGGSVRDDVPGKFAYNGAAVKPAYSNEPYTNYAASFIPDDSDNYNTVNGLMISLTVSKMPISGSLAVTGIPMKGETLTVDISGLTPDEPGVYTFAWTMNGTQIGTGATLDLTEAHVGNEVIVTATAQGYYEGSVSYSITAVAPKLPSVKQIINATAYADYFDLTGLTVFGGTTELTYDAAQHEISLEQKSSTLNNTVVGTITVKYNGSVAIPSEAGLYNVTVDVATPPLDKANDNAFTVYSPATGIPIGTLKINKAPYYVTATVADKVYDGFNTASATVEENGAMALAGGMMDDVSFDAARAVYTFVDANVGTGKAVSSGNEALTGSAASNYELVFSLANGATASITPRTLNVRVEPVAREYQEDYYDVDLSFVVDTTTIAPADTSSSVYVNEALATARVDDCNAGTRRVTVNGVVLAGAKAANYSLNLTNINNLSVEIERATPSYPLPNTGVIYYDSGRTLSNISLGDSRWAWAESVANVIPQAGTHSFTAVFTPGDTANYAEVNYEVSLTVRKAPVVVKAASFTTVYGDYAPTYTYTVTGLTGADTIRNAVGGYVIIDCAYDPGKDVGQYAIVLDGAFTSDNYSFTYQNGTLTILPRPAYVTATAEGRPYEEGNTNVNVTFSELSNLYAGDSGSVRIGGTMPIVGTIADDNAGTKVVAYDLPALDGPKAGNYTLTLQNPELTVEIAKAEIPGVTLPTSGEVKFGARLSTTNFTSSYSGTEYGTFSMENPMSTPAAVGTTSDVYKVVFTPFNTINYATVSRYITLTVTTADLNVELTLSGSADVGKKLYVGTNDLPAGAAQYIEFRWYRLDSRTGDIRDGQLVASGTTEYTVTERDADHYIVCVATNKADSPYNINARIATEGTVSKKSMSLWERLLKWFYRVIASITQLFGKIGG